jgi:protein-S-isoprenylcysteine O-methyltransferase Ste14
VGHPQYSGLFLIIIGMLIQWSTIITAAVFPVLLFVCYRLSKREEGHILKPVDRSYMEKTPMFVPRRKR